LGYQRSESSRIALRGTAILIIAGTILFYLLESGNVMGHFLLPRKYLASLFQSVTLRTAGFNTVDIAALSRGTLLMAIPFMFVGAASGGTAGGIKLGTVAVVWSDIRRFALGRRDAELMYRRIPRRTVSQAYVLVVTGVVLVFVSLVVLSLTESAPLEVVLFEIVSALGTVGLSAGLTGELTTFGRVLIILLMFLGRLGPLTLVVALQPRPEPGEVRYPDGNPPIG
jgi:trk system potassium uptake protein TrkH